MSIRVLIADDYALFRAGLRLMLERDGFEVVGEASDGCEAVEIGSLMQPDVAVLDLYMPNLSGLEAAKQIRQRSPRTRILLLTEHLERSEVSNSLFEFFAGYVPKEKAINVLADVIFEVAQGAMYFCDGWLPSRKPLSGRELEVFQLLVEGKRRKEIASLLHLSVKTVEAHRCSIMAKLNFKETADLVRFAIRQGSLHP